MRRSLTLVVLTLGAMLSTSLGAVQPAAAWERFGCSFSTGSLRWQDLTTRSGYSQPATAAMRSWDNSANALLTLIEVTSGANIIVADGNFGAVIFDGIVQDVNGNDPRVNCDARGHWTANVRAWANRYHTDGYPSAARQSVYTHEIGHALGLGHASARSCPNVPIMQPDTETRYFICRYSTPRPDDIDGIEVLY